MSQRPQSAPTGRDGASNPFGQLLASNQERAGEFRELQESVSKVLQSARARWFARLKQGAARSTRLSRALLSSRSYPDAANAWQQWASEEAQSIAQDGKEMMDNGKRIAEATTRFVSGYFHTNGKTVGSNKMPSSKVATRRDVEHLLGALDGAVIVQILALEPSLLELQHVAASLRGDGLAEQSDKVRAIIGMLDAEEEDGERS